MLDNYTPFKNQRAMKVNINNTEIELKQSFRAHIIYEQVKGETFQPKGLTEIITFLYCVIMASAPTLELEFNDFVNWLDGNPSTVSDFSDWMVECNRKQGSLAPQMDGKETKPTKPTAKKKK